MATNLNKLLEEIKEISTKLNNSEIDIEESIKLFREGTEKINQAKEGLKNIEGEVKKVISETETEKF